MTLSPAPTIVADLSPYLLKETLGCQIIRWKNVTPFYTHIATDYELTQVIKRKIEAACKPSGYEAIFHGNKLKLLYKYINKAATGIYVIDRYGDKSATIVGAGDSVIDQMYAGLCSHYVNVKSGQEETTIPQLLSYIGSRI